MGVVVFFFFCVLFEGLFHLLYSARKGPGIILPLVSLPSCVQMLIDFALALL